MDMGTFQQSVFSWYGISIPDEETRGLFKPLASMRSLGGEEPWGPTQWMYWMQSMPVSEDTRLAMLAFSWRVAFALKDLRPSQALPWLSLWESLHHTRAEYSKRSGIDEYTLVAKYDFVPSHLKDQIEIWGPWLAQLAVDKATSGASFVPLVPFMAYYPWLDAMATSCPQACKLIEDAIEETFEDSQPTIFYTQHQWVVWCLRNRHPNDTYDSRSLMHRLFSEHTFLQLACFWYAGEKKHPRSLMPADIPKVWQRPLFAGSDITDMENPDWQQAWVEVISMPHWARRLSFWVAMVKVRRTKTTPAWLDRVLQEHPTEWRFFERMHSWMSQMPPYVEPTLNHANMTTFRADSLDYEYNLARALWVMYNNNESVETFPLPNLDE